MTPQERFGCSQATPSEIEEQELTGRDRINAFTNQNDFYQHLHRFEGFKALVIEPKGLVPVTSEELLDYVDEFPKIKRRGLGAVCLDIAKYSHEQNRGRGRLLGGDEITGLTSYSNHYLVKYSLGDGSVIACDLTAPLGTGEDIPEVLVIREADDEKLIEALGQLYDGDWQQY